MGHPPPRYTVEFKQRAVKHHGEHGGAYAGLASELCCDAGSKSDWVKRADATQAPSEALLTQSARLDGSMPISRATSA